MNKFKSFVGINVSKKTFDVAVLNIRSPEASGAQSPPSPRYQQAGMAFLDLFKVI